MAPDVPVMVGDRDRLGQVLSNLVSNALKFTPPQGRVSVRARLHHDNIHVSVQDTGPGVHPDSLPHIFDRFWQADRTSSAGAGLGLQIAKGIVEAHRGSIWAESELGRGTTFHFTVPVRRW
ncbi:MAG: sensor histidine kinase [Gammaproteobacteria bacterium]